MPGGTKVECFSGEDNSLVEVLHCPELLVPIDKAIGKVSQGQRPIRISLRAKVECFSAEDNGAEALHCPEVLVSRGKIDCEVVQND